MHRPFAAILILMASFLFARESVAFEISEETNANYQAYLKQIGSTKRGAFAVSPEGNYSYYVYCVETRCDTGINDQALQECRSLSGKDCLIMASGRNLRMDISISPSKTKLSSTDEIKQFVLDAERLRRLTIGNTLSGEYPNGQKWVEYYDPSGEIRGKDDAQGAYKAKYDFEGDKICFDYAGTNNDWCGQVSSQGNHIEFIEGGDLITFFRNTVMQPGNTEGL